MSVHDPIPIIIIIVCRNALPMLVDTLASVKALKDERVRTIVIDGASTDGTAEFLGELAKEFLYSVSEPDDGIYDAMNKGWSAAPMDSLILYLGAGDLIFELPRDADIRDGAGRPFDIVLGQTSVGSRPYVSKWRSEIRLRNTAHHQAMMVNKRLSPSAPFDHGLKVYADWDFNLRLFRQGVSVKSVSTLRSYAQPGGASWGMDLEEIRYVASRHSGAFIGIVSLMLNSITRWRRFRREIPA